MESLESAKKCLIEYFTSEHYKNISIEVEPGSKLGDGYIGEIVRAKVRANKDDLIEEFDLIVKRAPSKPEKRGLFSMSNCFKREILIYSSVIKKYHNIMNKFQLSESFKCKYAKCYGYSDEKFNEFLILENLKTQGYVQLDGSKPSNQELAKVVLKSFAKMHGLSIMFETIEPAEFKAICILLTDVIMAHDEETNGEKGKLGIKHYGKRASDMFFNAIVGFEDVKTKIKKELGDDSDLLTCLAEQLGGTGRLNVITHADSWINNMLFRYNNGVPVEMAPIDFQVCRCASIANDITYFFGTSWDSGLKDHFWPLVHEYHNSLRQFLDACSKDVDEFMTLDQLEAEVKDRSILAIIGAMISLPIFTSDLHLDANAIFSINAPEELFMPNGEYIKRSNDLISNFVELNLI